MHVSRIRVPETCKHHIIPTVLVDWKMPDLKPKLRDTGLAGVLKSWPTIAVYNTKSDGDFKDISFDGNGSENAYITRDGSSVPLEAVALLSWKKKTRYLYNLDVFGPWHAPMFLEPVRLFLPGHDAD